LTILRTLSIAEATALRDDFVARGRTTSWAYARCAQDEVARQVADVRWSDKATVSGHLLASRIDEYFALAHARDHFLPPQVSPDRLGARWMLFLHHLWVVAERNAGTPGAVLVSAMLTAASGSRALREMECRLDGRVGVDAALALLLLRVPAASYGAPDADEDELMQSLAGIGGRLRRSILLHVSASIRRGVTVAELRSQTAATLMERFGGEDTFEIIARALDGHLDVAGAAVGNDLTRHLNKGLPPRRTKRKTWTIEFGASLDEKPSRARSPEATLIDSVRARSDRSRLRLARAADPDVFEALTKSLTRTGVRKKAAAEKLRVSRPTLDIRLVKMSRAASKGAAK
jgi:hypothetical protein